MELKSTDELEKILGSTHINNISSYFTENEDSIINNEYAFHDFIRMLIKKKKLKQQDVFLAADIPENFSHRTAVRFRKVCWKAFSSAPRRAALPVR